LEHLSDFATMLEIEDAKITSDMNRCATTRRAAALFPTRLRAVEYRARGAVHHPALRRVGLSAILTMVIEKGLPDLPTKTHVSP